MRFPVQRLAAALIVFAASTAHADRPIYRPDGSVKVGTKTYSNASAYFTSTAALTSGARCGTPVEAPAPAAAPSDCSLSHTTINAEYNDARVFVIQVVFHIIKRTDGTGAVTPALLQSQIDILNEDFDALTGTPGAGGHNIKLQFVLAQFDPDGNPTPGYDVTTNNSYFNDPGPGSSSAMKQALHWDTTRYFNVYTNDSAGYLGYATFPQEEAGGVEDGVVVLYSAVGRDAPAGPPYDQGRTLTHETGHYFGLLHTFQDGCSSPSSPHDSGDLIGDTVPESDAQFGCSPGPSACGGGNNPITNYMDYTDDTCMTNFSTEQANRVRCSIVNYRTVNTAPTAAFTSSIDHLDVAFTNTSSDAESALGQLVSTWTFGDGGTATTTSPNHHYTTAGTYDVALEVVDPGSGTSTVTHSVVTVSPSLPDARPPDPPDAHTNPGDPDARPADGQDADPGNPGDDTGMGGGGCCQVPGSGTSSVACGLVVALVLGGRRRRRR